LTHFQQILKYHSSWKYVQWMPSCSTRVDNTQTEGRTEREKDMPKLGADFQNFCLKT